MQEPSESRKPADPTQIGPYAIERKIGSGGMGAVYLGRHQESGREAAVKVLPPSMAREEGFVHRFSREIDSMKQLHNPHVVEFYDSGIDDETYYYAMEYVEGETLATVLRDRKRLPWREVIDIAVQICSALKAAHDAGIVHRDLKPSNLLLQSDGIVKLTDFGVAQVFASHKLTVTGGIVGTAEFMSPEQAQGKRATRQSDLYSLGAVMYAMLTGRPPFSGKTTLDVIRKHAHGRFDPPAQYVAEIPHWLDEIVCKLLAKDPEERFPNAYVLSLRLQEVVKKVDLSSRDDTLAFAGENVDSGTATLAFDVAADAGPGQATLMRDLMRAELEAQRRPTPVGSLLDNTWVLLALLAGIIGFVTWWFTTRDLAPEEMFARGEAIMQQPEGPEWLQARDEYFLPLLEEDEQGWKERVDPYIGEIDAYSLKLSLRRRRLLRHDGDSADAERFLSLARHYQQIGDTPRAERMLQSLETLLAGDPAQQKLYKVTRDLLQEIENGRQARQEQESLIDSTTARAEALWSDGQADEARRLCRALLTLYEDYPESADALQRARELLAQEIPGE